MQVSLSNSDLTLLLPKGYLPVANGEELHRRIYARQYSDAKTFLSLSAVSYGNIIIGHINPSDAMSFGDSVGLIDEIHSSLLDNQGLIEVETGVNPRGFEYIYSIIKTYHQDLLNVNYCLRMDIKNDEEIIEVSASFFEDGMTGQRSAMAWGLAQAAGFEYDEETQVLKGWCEDPYSPDYRRGCPMIAAERPALDGLFPDDPLSQARELVLALTKDSYYMTQEEIKGKKKGVLRRGLQSDRRGKKKAEEEADEQGTADVLRRLFSPDSVRAGEYKVEFNGTSFTEGTDNPKTKRPRVILVKPHKVKTPFVIPDDYCNRLNKRMPKSLPGWGRRKIIGFGKSNGFINAVLLSWQVSKSESLPLSDGDSLLRCLYEGMNESQGMIQANYGVTHKGNQYAFGIRKTLPVDEDGNRLYPTSYELSFNIMIGGRIHFIVGSFRAVDNPGSSRETILDLMRYGSRDLKLDVEPWRRDPYDPERKEGFLMEWYEDEQYDSLFPQSPLAEMRRFVRAVVECN